MYDSHSNIFIADDATVHEFKLFAVNAEGFGEPAIVQFTTPKRGNVTFVHMIFENNSLIMR